jgi:hypothetical protein
MPLNIIVIGAGTYGSYLANSIADKFPDASINLFEVGNYHTQSEQEIGFLSKVKNEAYRASSAGRFFGLGGTSAKWGGQLLFFSKKDFGNDKYMREVVNCNINYQNKVLGRFFKEVPLLEEKPFDKDLFVKKGIWLKFGNRNLFELFKLAKRKNIHINQNLRVVKLNMECGKITSISVQPGASPNKTETYTADLFYLTSGAFESLRLLQVSGVLDIKENTQGFADHISLRCFKINSPSGKLGAQDFQFRFVNGSLITSRLVGELDRVSYFIHPIFNEDFNIFQFLKQLVFKGRLSGKKLAASVNQVSHIFPFLYNYLFLNKLYIYGSWYINIDIELATSDNFISLSNQTDRYGQKAIDISYKITPDTVAKLMCIKKKVKKLLEDNGVNFTEVAGANATSLKLEDTYHPYGLFKYKIDDTILDVYNPLKNLFIFNTGLLKRAGGINPTAALFCLIEQHIETVLPHYQTKILAELLHS